MPAELAPELCFLTKTPPDGNNWIHEQKFDGYRLMAFIDKKQNSVKLITRNGKDWTHKFPVIVKALQNLPVSSAILDGELVAVDKRGISHFQYLQNSLKGASSHPIFYYIFDLPYYNGYSLVKLSILDRKRLLKNIIMGSHDGWAHKKLPNKKTEHMAGNSAENKAENRAESKTLNPLIYSEHIQGNGGLVYKKACKNKLEGIVSKDISSPYESRRSKLWLKSKCIQRQEFVIGGYTKPKGKRLGFGSLLIGLYNAKRQFIYCGHVGTGFDSRELVSLYKKLTDIRQRNNPFQNLKDRSIINNASWVKPELIVELEFSEWTEDKILRHPSFLGLRQDKTAGNVGEEKVINDNIIFEGVSLSHPKKTISVDKSISKLQLAEYYSKIQKWILPHLVKRPLSLLRCPTMPCFFNKHYSGSFPEGIYPIDAKAGSNHYAAATADADANAKQDFLFIQSLLGLIALVQMNVLEIHPWGSSNKNLDKPDRVIFDLDPGPNVLWAKITKGAELVHKELKKLGLVSYVKTTGGKGLHIVLPIAPKNSWDQVKHFSETLSRFMAEKYPDIFTATVSKSKRIGKIYLDYLRNTRGATAVAAYSTRASVGCPVSTPIAWSELKKIQSSKQFNLGNILIRLNKLKKDPWAGFFECKQQLPT